MTEESRAGSEHQTPSTEQAEPENPIPSTGPDGIDDILGEINAQLARESDRKKSLEQRAITVITTSSALATIVFTVVAAMTKIGGAENFVKEEHIWIQIGVGLFVLAAAAALVVNAPLPYGAIDADGIPNIVTWIDQNREKTSTHLAVVRRLVENGIEDLKLWQKQNLRKAIILECAFFFEVAAVGFLLVSLMVILTRI